MKYKILLSLIFLFITMVAYSQTGVMQDGEGKSSLYFSKTEKNIGLNFNAADKSLTISLMDSSVSTQERIFFGGQLKLGGKDGKVPALKDGVYNFQMDGSVTMFILPKKDDARSFFYITPKIGVSRLFITDDATPGTISTQNKTTFGKSVQVGYNIDAIGPTGIIVGVAVEAGYWDNTKTIDAFEYRTVQASGVDASGNPVMVTTVVKDTYLSSQYRPDVKFTYTMIDAGYKFPAARLMPMIHLRWQSFSGDNTSTVFNPGVGLYFLEKGKPSKVIFGLQGFINDYNDEKHKETKRSERFSLNFVVGFKF